MKTGDSNFVVCGAGTVNYGTLRAIASGSTPGKPARVTVVDPAPIRPSNGVTCPLYAGRSDLKCDRLAALVREWFPGCAVRAAPVRVQELHWPALVGCGDGLNDVVMVGLDDWDARVAVAEDVRATGVPGVVTVQSGLTRGEAQVSIYGSRYDEPCPACGLAVLPHSEPCVVLTEKGDLLRGDLQAEVRSVGDFVANQLVAGFDGVLNTKTHLVIEGGTARVSTRRCRMQNRCVGPHSPRAPLRWDRLIEPLRLAEFEEKTT